MHKALDATRILITGGTGSFGQRFVKKTLENNPNIERLVVFSRDELKQYEMSKLFPESKYPGIRFFLGDIRDKGRLSMALEGINTVIHAAALKQVPAAEYNPFEFIKTNIYGAQNLVECCLEKNIKKVVALSTDKASAPINLYGATKLCSDKLFIAGNHISGKKATVFSLVRYGNVIGSRGSVVPFFRNISINQKVPITDKRMTRFTITLDEGISLVNFALNTAKGGEIYVPKLPSYNICDVAKAICPDNEIELIGIRPGEKIHESMISEAEGTYTWDIGDFYIIMPPGKYSKNQEDNLKKLNAKKVPLGFKYTSGENNHFLNIQELRNLIEKEFGND